MFETIVSPSQVLVDPNLGIISVESTPNVPAPPQTALSPSRYAIILSDKDGNVKGRLEHLATNIRYSWLAQGGCGPLRFTIPGDYIRITVNPDDDVQIWLPNETSGATLVYRGFVEAVTPSLNTGDAGDINVEANGYFALFERIVVQSSGNPREFDSVEISSIVNQIITDHVLPYGPITLGTIDASSFTPDILSFKTTIREALQTLADLAGAVEYGVDVNRQFFWRNRSTTITHKFYLGDKVVKLNDKIDFKKIFNKLYLEGGDVDGATFVLTATSQASIDRYRLREKLVSNGSIISTSVGNKYLSSLLKQQAGLSRQLSINLISTKKRLEASLPIGAVSVVDPDTAQTSALYGTTGNGGSNKLYGTVGTGGANQLYGGVTRGQVDRINYSINPKDGRFDAEIMFESYENVSPASATLKQIQQNLDALRQRGL